MLNDKAIAAKVTRVLYSLISLLLASVACTTSDAIPQPTSDEPQGVTLTIMTVAATSATAPQTSVTVTTAIDVVPPTSTPTATAAVVATSVPLPTAPLTVDEKTALLTELMELDEGCLLPCWWEIVPGVSEFYPTLTRLADMGFRVGSSSAGMEGADDFLVYLAFESEDGVITSVEVSGDYLIGTEEETNVRSQAFARGWRNYSVAEMLNTYGLPSRIFIYSPFRADPGGGPGYHLLLFYEQLGIVAEYWGNAEQLDAERYRACLGLDKVGSIRLLLYRPEQSESIVERVLPPDSLSFLGDPGKVYDLVSWEHATGTSLSLLPSALASSEGPVCFEFANSP